MTARIYKFTARQPQARPGAGHAPSAPEPLRYIAPHRLAQLTRDEGYDDFIRADGRTRLGTPYPDYPVGVRFVPSHRKAPFGERMTLWFRLNGEAATFAFAMFAVGLLLVVVVCAFVGVGR
jgi:hypothetical protein